MRKRANFLFFIFTLAFLGSSLTPLQTEAATKNGDVIESANFVNGGIDLKSEPIKSDKKIRRRRSSKPRNVELHIPFQTQKNDYYCGPTAAAMIVNSLGYNKTQDYMASLLGTTTNGTNAGNNVANALNKVVKGSKFEFRWEWQQYYQIDKMKNHIVEALSYGNPVMVNTVESPGDVYLQGHDIGTALYHYGIVADYFDYGNELTYVDPGYGRYRGFKMNQRVTIKNMSYATGTRGYAW